MSFKDKLSKTLNAAADKSVELAGIAKDKVEISSKKSNIEKLYKELGEVVYEASKTDSDVSEDIKSFCDKINKINSELAALEENKEK